MRVLVLLLVALILWTGRDARAEGAGTRVVRTANEQVTALLRGAADKRDDKLAAEVAAALHDFLDIDELGRRTLVDHWSKLSKSDVATVTKLLRELVEARYIQELRTHAGYEVRFLGETAERDGSLVVRTEVHTRKRNRKLTISIDYRLHAQGTTWRVHDVVTDGAALVENYRAQFNRIIAKKGFAGLVETLKAKRATL